MVQQLCFLAVKNNHVEVVKGLSAGVDFTVEANQKAWMEVFKGNNLRALNVNISFPTSLALERTSNHSRPFPTLILLASKTNIPK